MKMIKNGIKILTWNVRGIRNRKKRNAIFRILKKEKFDIIALQETYIVKKDIDQLEKEWGGVIHWQEGTHHSAGILTLFGKHIDPNRINPKFKSERFLISNFKTSEEETLEIINVYAPCDQNRKSEVFEAIRKQADETCKEVDSGKIIVLGDFNCVVNNEIDIIAGIGHADHSIKEFKKLIRNLGLRDEWRNRNPKKKEYSWSRNNPFIARRLDYILLGKSLAPYTKEIKIRSMGFSDHRAIECEIDLHPFSKGPSYFKLNTNILKEEQYGIEIKREIKQLMENESRLDPHLSWEMIKSSIIELSMTYCKNRRRKDQSRKDKLISELNDMESNINNTLSHKEYELSLMNKKKELEILQIKETRGAQIRAGIKWVEEGEKCSKFFCNLEKKRAIDNTLRRVRTKDSNIVNSPSMVLEEIKKYYQSLYAELKESGLHKQKEKLWSELSIPQVKEEDKLNCDKDLTEKEVLEALQTMKNGSAPGLDGIPVEFYKTFWDIIKTPLLEAYKYSWEKGQLCPSQRLGIISLLHKGKEREDLNNWRPITLTNVDYKILAKVFARRLRTIVTYIIHEDQSGFIHGRNISSVLRELDDIIQECNQQQDSQILLSIDFRKAFDTISMSYLREALGKFGFGKTFIKWIDILNNRRKSCVKNAGYISPEFAMERGVRQGCPLSPLLFVIGVEIMAMSIRQDKTIKGIEIQGIYTAKIKQYADDTTLFVKNSEELKRMVAKVDNFSKISGLELNKAKTLAMWMGKKEHPENHLDIGIAFVDEIKILGIYYSNKILAGNNKRNWEKKIEEIERILKSWTKRDITIMGKIQIIKTFCVSQLTYIMQSIGIPKEVLHRINTLFFQFIWKKKNTNKRAFEKIKRKVMCSPVSMGGLNMVDITQIQDASLLAWVEKIIFSKCDSFKRLVENVLKPMGGFAVFKSNTSIKTFRGINTIQNIFWKRVIETWVFHNGANHLPQQDLKDQVIFNNDNITIAGKVIFIENLINKGLRYVKDICNGNKIYEFEQLKNKVGNYPKLVLDYWTVYNAIPKDTRLHSCIQAHSTREYDENNLLNYWFKSTKIGNLGKKGFQNLISHHQESHALNFWKRKFDNEMNEILWELGFTVTKEVRLRVLHWKILSNIYPTNILLHKMGIAPSRLCKWCHEEDYIEHFFFNCCKVKPLWLEIENRIYLKYSRKITLTDKCVILGVTKMENCNKKIWEEINYLILLGKMVISKWKYGYQSDILNMFEHEAYIRQVTN